MIKTFSMKMKSDHRLTSEELRYLRTILKANRQELSSMIHQGVCHCCVLYMTFSVRVNLLLQGTLALSTRAVWA